MKNTILSGLFIAAVILVLAGCPDGKGNDDELYSEYFIGTWGIGIPYAYESVYTYFKNNTFIEQDWHGRYLSKGTWVTKKTLKGDIRFIETKTHQNFTPAATVDDLVEVNRYNDPVMAWDVWFESNASFRMEFVSKYLSDIIYYGYRIEESVKTYTVSIGTLTNANGCTIEASPDGGKEGTGIGLGIFETNGYRLKPGTLKYGTTFLSDAVFSFILPAENVTVSAEFEQVFFESDIIGIWQNFLDRRFTFYENGTYTEQLGSTYRQKGTWKAAETSKYGVFMDFTVKTRPTHSGESVSIDGLPPLPDEYDWESELYFGFVSKSSSYIQLGPLDDHISTWERVNE